MSIAFQFSPLFLCTSILCANILLLPIVSGNAQLAKAAETTDPSQSILSRCWSAAELKGTAKELRSRRVSRRERQRALRKSQRQNVRKNMSFQWKQGAAFSGTFSMDKLISKNKSPLKSNQPAPSHYRGTVRWVKLPKGKKLIALTFDLCEAYYRVSGYDGRVIDYLRSNKIKATLFVGGKWLDSHPERAQQLIADPLFELGSHGWSHRNLRKTFGKRLHHEINAVQGAYERAYSALNQRHCFRGTTDKDNLSIKTPPPVHTPERLSLFRFPFGTCHEKALDAVQAAGQVAIQWDVVTGDPAPRQSARRIATIIKNRAKPGSIIIAHANGRGRNTAKALPLFIPELIQKGYKFVTVTELLAAGDPQFATTCYENRPGDNLHYK